MAEKKTPLKWKFETEKGCSSLALSGGMVYFGSDDNHLYALDIKTGEEKWKFETGEEVSSSPAVSVRGQFSVHSFNCVITSLLSCPAETRSISPITGLILLT